MKEYKLKKDTLANSREGMTIIKCGKLTKGTVLNQKEILDIFDLTEEEEEFKDWFEPIEPKEFTRSDMLGFAKYYFKLDYGNQNDPNLLDFFIKERRKQNE